MLSKGAQAFAAGQHFLAERRIEAALQCLNEAQQSGFTPQECAAARWNCWMLQGQFEHAWRESAFIADFASEDPHRFWNGESWKGKRVILRCLHGLGDTIQFIRYAPMLRETCASLTVQVHPQLVTFIEGVPAIDRVITWLGSDDVASKEGEWDIQIEVTELPRIFATQIDSIPCKVPYVRIPENRLEWARALLPPDRSLKIGLAWEAGAWNPSRSIPPQAWAPLFAPLQHEFYSLQKDADPRIVGARVRHLESYCADVRDTAACISQLDLIISVDTMTAHLAGALHKPVWLLLPHKADWRWMLHRNDTPWYPSLQLFRQSTEGNWNGVIEELAKLLEATNVVAPSDSL